MSDFIDMLAGGILGVTMTTWVLTWYGASRGCPFSRGVWFMRSKRHD